ncbi:MAG: hypothetical protein HY506_00385 [Candidatus Yanofskybacteria bacterium]|nr:hypothetical protein [Candidatus Yanofskybacteria bacterium]
MADYFGGKHDNFCPKCSVDIADFNRRKKERELFESEYGEYLKPFRKRAGVTARAMGTATALVLTLILRSEHLNPFETINLLRKEFSDPSQNVWSLAVFFIIWCIFCIPLCDFFTRNIVAREENNLRSDFNPYDLHPTD